MNYPKEITDLEQEIRSTHNAIHNAWRQGRIVPKKTSKELNRLQRRLDRMKQLYWMIALDSWLGALKGKT